MDHSTTGLSLREVAARGLHHDGGGFLNPFTDAQHGNLFRVLRWKLFSTNRFRDQYREERLNPVRIDWEPIKQHRGLSVTFLKHATVLIKDQGTTLMVDPVLYGLFWFIEDFTPLAFKLDRMPRPDHVLITHGHYDHLDKPSLAYLGQETSLVTPLGYNDLFEDLGMRQRAQLDWFDTFQKGKLEITLLPCNHWTMRNPLTGPNRSLWGSFLIKTSTGPTIFISGDTAYFNAFREIGRAYDIDLAIFNLGAYEPRWFMASSHINPAETVQAFRELDARHLMAVHWGTFRLGDEPVHLPPVHIRKEMDRAGLRHRLMDLSHGQTLLYDSPVRII
jgi:L-ascorbate metabolism protein UlaG (beta-lactamase superfamily)